jgi:hypothetical protein
MDLMETEARNDCTGEGQQQFNRRTNRKPASGESSGMEFKLQVGSPTQHAAEIVAPGGGVGGVRAPIVVSRCVATPS